MRWVGRISLGVFAAVLILVGVVLVRTLTYGAPGEAAGRDVQVAPAVAMDVAGAARRLSQAIQIRTVSHQDPAQNQPAEWDRLHAFLQASYPAAHATMSRETVAGHTLIYTWPGSEPTLAPVVLMAHQDVVPVTPGSEGGWKQAPFAGAIADGAVWGRGAIDDKGSLIALFEAVENLAARGFRPKRTLILVNGHDEEVRGTGAQAAAAALKARGVKAQFVLDEGLVVITDNPVTGQAVALIGTAEKGYATLKVTAQAPGGHSSTPPADSGGVAALARAVTRIVDDPFPMAFRGPGAEMLRTLAPTAPFLVKMAVANQWLFGPLLVDQMSASAPGAALLHTTIAPTMLRGSPKENVLPQDATAWINYRLAPGDTSAEVMAKARAAVGDLPVTLAWETTPEEASPVSSTSSEGWRILHAVAGAVTGAPVSASLVLGGTDSRYMSPIATDIYRFQPMSLTLDDVGVIHGANERLTLKNLEQAVQFYARLIETSTR